MRPGQVQQGAGEGSGECARKPWCKAKSVQRVLQKVPREGSGEGLGGFGAEPGQVQQKVPEKVPGSLGAKPSQVQQGPGEGSSEGSGEGLGGFGAEPGQVQQGPREGSGEGLGGFDAEPGQAQQGSEEGSGEGLGGFGAEPGEVQGFPEKGRGEGPEKVWVSQRLASQHSSERFVKIKRCGCWGYHQSLLNLTVSKTKRVCDISSKFSS